MIRSVEFTGPISLRIGPTGYYESLSFSRTLPRQAAEASFLFQERKYRALDAYLSAAIPLLPLTVMGFIGPATGAVALAASAGSALLSSGALAGFRALKSRVPSITFAPPTHYRPPNYWRR